jgi:hypothetical protein
VASMHRATEQLVAEILREGGRIPGEQSRLLREQALAEGMVDVDDVAVNLLVSVGG